MNQISPSVYLQYDVIIFYYYFYLYHTCTQVQYISLVGYSLNEWDNEVIDTKSQIYEVDKDLKNTTVGSFIAVLFIQKPSLRSIFFKSLSTSSSHSFKLTILTYNTSKYDKNNWLITEEQ